MNTAEWLWSGLMILIGFVAGAFVCAKVILAQTVKVLDYATNNIEKFEKVKRAQKGGGNGSAE